MAMGQRMDAGVLEQHRGVAGGSEGCGIREGKEEQAETQIR